MTADLTQLRHIAHAIGTGRQANLLGFAGGHVSDAVDEIVALRAAVADLVAIATDARPHTYSDGLCPDRVEGPDTRDPECPACQAITRALRALGEDERRDESREMDRLAGLDEEDRRG